MNLTIRPITAADRKNISCNLEGYWGIFEDDRVSAVSRDRTDLERLLDEAYGTQEARTAA